MSLYNSDREKNYQSIQQWQECFSLSVYTTVIETCFLFYQSIQQWQEFGSFISPYNSDRNWVFISLYNSDRNLVLLSVYTTVTGIGFLSVYATVTGIWFFYQSIQQWQEFGSFISLYNSHRNWGFISLYNHDRIFFSSVYTTVTWTSFFISLYNRDTNTHHNQHRQQRGDRQLSRRKGSLSH